MPASVFVSSTCREFQDLRATLDEFIRSYSLGPIISEKTFPVAPHSSPLNASIEAVQRADIFVLLVGSHAGTTAPCGCLTYTREEYRAASNLNLPVYVFVRDDVWHPIARRGGTLPHSLREAAAFMQEILEQGSYIQQFRDATELKTKLSDLFAELIRQGLRRARCHEFWTRFRTRDPISFITEVRDTQSTSGGVEQRKNINGTYGLTTLFAYLREREFSVEMFSGLETERVPSGHVILDGSHLSNPITKRLLEHPATRARLVYANRSAGDLKGARGDPQRRMLVPKGARDLRKYESEYTEAYDVLPGGEKTKKARRVKVDYGLLVRLRNPSDPKGWCIIASGNHGAGTYACLKALTMDQHLDQIMGRAGPEDEFEAVVSVEMKGIFKFAEPYIHDVRRLP